MSLFGTLLSKIFPSSHPAAKAEAKQPGGQQASGQAATPQQTAQAAQPATAQQPSQATGPGGGTSATQPPPASTAQPVDVEKILDDMASRNSQKLNWRTSIVDLMKLVGMDSSFDARKELAKELGYDGDFGDSAKMNMWLHKQVMQKIAQNGGKLPQDLLH